MRTTAPIKRRFTESSASALDQLCAAIKSDDMAAFDVAVEQVSDLDADNNRILRACIEHDRFTMAKKLFLRGAASSVLLEELEGASNRAKQAFMNAPSSNDRQELAAYQAANLDYLRLKQWRTTFDKDILPIITLHTIQDLQKQIADLRREVADVVAPARSVIKKPTAP